MSDATAVVVDGGCNAPEVNPCPEPNWGGEVAEMRARGELLRRVRPCGCVLALVHGGPPGDARTMPVAWPCAAHGGPVAGARCARCGGGVAAMADHVHAG